MVSTRTVASLHCAVLLGLGLVSATVGCTGVELLNESASGCCRDGNNSPGTFTNASNAGTLSLCEAACAADSTCRGFQISGDSRDLCELHTVAPARVDSSCDLGFQCFVCSTRSTASPTTAVPASPTPTPTDTSTAATTASSTFFLASGPAFIGVLVAVVVVIGIRVTLALRHRAEYTMGDADAYTNAGDGPSPPSPLRRHRALEENAGYTDPTGGGRSGPPAATSA
eukprot:m.110734 g.110734  ORF g.110734 m.110734 type:complete len:227 (-) comp21328_c0_seq1:125-805(-)